MKNKKIIIPAVLLALTAASISPFISAQAATNDTNATGTSMTQKIKNFFGKEKHNQNAKNTNKTPKTAAELAALKTARDAKTAAVTTALDNGNYDAWLAAVSALEVNPNANVNATTKANGITSKITRDNFPKLVEAYNLEKQLEAKLTELGINKGNGGERGMGLGLGMGMGQWK